MAVRHLVPEDVLVPVLVLQTQFIIVLHAIMLVQLLVRQFVRNLAKMDVRLAAILHAKIIAHQDVKELVKVDAQEIVRRVVKGRVKVAVVAAAASIVLALVLQLVWVAVILVWAVEAQCSTKYGEGTKRLLARRHGKDNHIYCDERLPISLQILLLGWQEFQGENVLENSQASYRLCA